MPSQELVLLLSADLMIGSQIQGEVQRAGRQLQVVTSSQQMLELCRKEQVDIILILVDLSSPALNVADLMKDIKSLDRPPTVVAFGPHVHAQKLQAAREAGCDQVLSRGQFHASMGEVIAAT